MECLEGPGRLYKLPERLMAHAWRWNLEVPALGVARHFIKALGDGDNNSVLIRKASILRWDISLRSINNSNKLNHSNNLLTLI